MPAIKPLFLIDATLESPLNSLSSSSKVAIFSLRPSKVFSSSKISILAIAAPLDH